MKPYTPYRWGERLHPDGTEWIGGKQMKDGIEYTLGTDGVYYSGDNEFTRAPENYAGKMGWVTEEENAQWIEEQALVLNLQELTHSTLFLHFVLLTDELSNWRIVLDIGVGGGTMGLNSGIKLMGLIKEWILIH
ncbi:hypothetical protein E2P81_ATG05737 [Venturia nashicola]|uniref:Uncharacterized protein n=1 Tax=Venturia nashicola TaxID=86259 RepID=A0A4Z1P947_9PEZI|nr:hypothetical protein E6O75_ATG05880 [Venturia nashicola]TLD29443.1 hypothetical protein E2P81_ATG05737 [Venturia nashicola]